MVGIGLGLFLAFTAGAQPVITNQPVNQTVWGGCYATFSVGISNAESYTYQWLQNNTPLPDNLLISMVGGPNNKLLNGYPVQLPLNAYGVAPDALGNVYFSDYNAGLIYKLDANNYHVQLIAGGGTATGTGPATNVSLSGPAGLAVDRTGNLFIADVYNCCIWKIDTNGIINMVAGNGTADYAGDGGNATNASLCFPFGVAVDGFGNLLIADTGNQCIRKVSTNGMISTIVGKFSNSGSGGFSGDGGAATNAEISLPFGVAVDANGYLFIADTDNNRIRKVDTNGIITTVAGVTYSGSFSGDGGAATNANLYAPDGVAVDTNGNLFIADGGNNRVRKVDTNGIINTIAGGGFSNEDGAATDIALPAPSALAVDLNGTMLIANNGGTSRLSKLYDTHKQTFTINTKLPIYQIIISNGIVVSSGFVTINAGTYQVIITGSSGSVTSSVVNLTVASTPLITQAARIGNGDMELNFLSQPGSTNQVLCATNLIQTIWQPIATNLAGADGNWQFTDTNTASSTMQFYRSQTQ